MPRHRSDTNVSANTAEGHVSLILRDNGGSPFMARNKYRDVISVYCSNYYDNYVIIMFIPSLWCVWSIYNTI